MTTEVDPKNLACEPVSPGLSSARRTVGIIALLMSTAALWFGAQLNSGYPLPHDFHDKIDRPVLAIELPRSAADLKQVLSTSDPSGAEAMCIKTLRSSNQQNMPKNKKELNDAPKKAQPVCGSAMAVAALRTNTYEDFLFIVLYTLYVWRFAALCAVRADGSPMKLAQVVGWVALATGLLDCAENIGILRVLRADSLTEELALATWWPSTGKWISFGVTLLVTAYILLRSAGPIYSLATRRLLAIGYAISGVLLLVGPARPPLIELATLLFALLAAVNLIALLGPFIARRLPENDPEYVSDFCEKKRAGKEDIAVRPHSGPQMSDSTR
jgi:hypothetical protein